MCECGTVFLEEPSRAGGAEEGSMRRESQLVLWLKVSFVLK